MRHINSIGVNKRDTLISGVNWVLMTLFDGLETEEVCPFFSYSKVQKIQVIKGPKYYISDSLH